MHITRPVHLDESATVRFLKRLPSGTDCWEWPGARNKAGYGVFVTGGRSNQTRYLAHRVSFVIHKGQLPDGMLVCHTCDNPPCCNPDHLFMGDGWANMRDAVAKGRIRTAGTHCPHGHEYNADNTVYYKDVPMCRTCKTVQAREGKRRELKRLRHAASSGAFIAATDELRIVADLYWSAIADGVAFYPRIRETLCLSTSQTQRRLMLCRAAGLIPTEVDKSSCRRGHAFTPENSYYPPGKERPICRTCDKMRRAAKKHGAVLDELNVRKASVSV